MEMKTIKFVLNGKSHEMSVRPWKSLLELIREDLGLTGTKEGCGQGECGACTVIMNGKTVNSCLVPAVEADLSEILTIEGVAEGEKLHPLQETFIEHGGMQCGFCTSGMIMSAKALLDKNPSAEEGEIREAVAGNFCRCTGYVKIIESIQAASERLSAQSKSESPVSSTGQERG